MNHMAKQLKFGMYKDHNHTYKMLYENVLYVKNYKNSVMYLVTRDRVWIGNWIYFIPINRS
jgi:hypothetical protein